MLGHVCHAGQKQEANFFSFWRWGFIVLTFAKPWCSVQVRNQMMLEKFKEDSELIAHGNGTTECLQTTTSIEMKPQPLNKAKQGKQKW